MNIPTAKEANKKANEFTKEFSVEKTQILINRIVKGIRDSILNGRYTVEYAIYPNINIKQIKSMFIKLGYNVKIDKKSSYLPRIIIEWKKPQ